MAKRKYHIRVSEPSMAWHGMAYLGQRDRLYIVCIEIIHIHKFHKSLSFFSLSLSIIGCGKPTNVRRLHAHSYKTIIDSKQVDWCMRFYFIFFIFFIHMASFLLMCFFFHHVSNTGKSYFHIDQAISSSGLGFGSRFAIDICRCRKGFCFVVAFIVSSIVCFFH